MVIWAQAQAMSWVSLHVEIVLDIVMCFIMRSFVNQKQEFIKTGRDKSQEDSVGRTRFMVEFRYSNS